jgi:two-component system chemotaxis response regulator CheB
VVEAAPVDGGRRRDIVVVGASAGGVEALQTLVGGFPADLTAAVFVVLHIPANGPRALAAILGRAGPLPAAEAEERAIPRPGTVRVAVPGRHLVFARQRVRLSQDPAVNGHRPSIDALFCSAAEVFGPRVIAVVLSGAGDDGSKGLVAATEAGGVGLVQDPDQAKYPSMPQQAVRRVPSATLSRVEDMGALIASLARRG